MKKNDASQWLVKLCLENGEPVRAYRILLTPEIAKMFLERMRANRPVRQRRVDFYAKKIKAGDWHYTGEPIIFNDLGQLINGQHRCHAVVDTGEAIEVLVVLDVSDVAFRFLDQGATRNGGDFLVDIPNRNYVAATLNWIWKEERHALHLGEGADIMATMPACEAGPNAR